MDSTTDSSPGSGETVDGPPSGQGESAAAAPSERGPDRGKRYQRVRMLLALTEWSVEMLLFAILLAAGWSVAIRDRALEYSQNPWLVVVIYFVPLGSALIFVSMGFSAVRTFVVDRRYGLSTQSSAVWLVDGIKALVLGGILALLAVEVLYVLLRRFPEAWWLLAGSVYSAFLVFFAYLAPVLIFPLFFKFTRLTDEEITGRLENLAQQAGTRVTGVYEVNLSRKTRAANAALVGFGRTRRIVLADTLLDNFTLDEIEAVLAHELAHHAKRHLAKAVAIQTATFFVLFWGVHWVLAATGHRWGLEGAADVANFPVIALAGTVLGLLILPITNAILRGFERCADEYALAKATRPWAFCSALRRLGQLNLADRTPHPLIEWAFYSHPALGNRIRRAKQILTEKGVPEGESPNNGEDGQETEEDGY